MPQDHSDNASPSMRMLGILDDEGLKTIGDELKKQIKQRTLLTFTGTTGSAVTLAGTGWALWTHNPASAIMLGICGVTMGLSAADNYSSRNVLRTFAQINNALRLETLSK